MPRQRKHHLVAKATDTTTLCKLPTHRQRFVLARDINVDTCDACVLATGRLRDRQAGPTGGPAGPMGGPGFAYD